MRKHWFAVLGLVVTSSLVAAACGDDDDSSSATTAGGATTTSSGGGAPTSGGGATTSAPPANDICTADRVGGSLRVHTQQAAVTLDPYTAVGAGGLSGWEMIPIYSQLMYFDQESGKFEPLVAKSLDSNADATEWKLTLRDGVKFGNGDPLDADAMMAHLDRHLAPDSKSIQRGPNRVFIKSYAKTGPMEVTFTLNAPYGNFPMQLTTGLGLVQNVKVVNAMGQEAFSKSPKGGGVGGWEVDSWTPPEATVLKAKANWWGGPVCIQQITVSQLPGVTQAYEAMKKDELQVATLNREPVTMDEAKKAYPFASALGHSSFMVLNNSGAGGYTGPLTDPRVRLAVAYAIDADVVNQRAFQGKGQPGKGVVAPGSSLLKPTQGIPYDPAKAKSLLETVKKEKGWDGSIQSVCANQPAANLEACITVEAMLTGAGFKVTANPLPIGQMVASVIVDKKFELVSSWGIIQSEITLYNGFVNVVDSRNPANQSGYKNPDMDAALDQMRAAQGIPAYEAALVKFQEIVNRDNPFVTYAAGEQLTIYKPNIHGILWHAGFNELLDKAYIAK